MNGRRNRTFHLDRESNRTLQEQLCDELRGAILQGKLAPGEPLTSSREMARDLGVSRNTVLGCYEQLIGEGYLETRPRSGIFVMSNLPSGDPAFRPNRKQNHRVSATENVEWKLTTPLPFRPCQPDVSLFPMAEWNRIRSRILRHASTKLLCYQSRYTLGLPSLRKSLANYLLESRGVQCQWDQIAITCGSQQALFFLSQILLRRGDKVLMEEPGYLGARNAFEYAGAKVLPLRIDENGAIPPSSAKGVKLMYTTPSRQFPTGATMPVGRRLQFQQLAENHSVWLIEDDYDSEFRYSQPPLPSMYSLGSEPRVIYIGTMSKVLYPSLRIGYVVLPEELVANFERLRLVVEDHGPLLEQAVLGEFIDSGAFYSHIRRCRKEYSQRLQVFLREMEKHDIPLDFPHSDGGMNLTGIFRDGRWSAEKLSVRLRSIGFDVPPLSQYSPTKTPEGLVFGFTPFPPKWIQSYIHKMAPVLRGETITNYDELRNTK